MASLPHISVAGACATATHGSGAANQNLAAAITALELVTADGDVVEFGRGDGSFPGAVVHLGALGVVTRLVLAVVPSFDVSQRVYEGLPLEVLDDHFAEIMASGYSVSMFTDWRAPRLTQLWIKSLAAPSGSPSPAPPAPSASFGPPITEAPWFTARPAPAARNPVPGLPPDTCTEQLGVPGRVVRAAAALPARVHPERGRRAAVGVPAARRARGGRPARAEPGPRPAGPGGADLRGPDDRRRRPVAEPLLPAGQRGLPLHLDPRHRLGAARGDPAGAATGPVRRAAALGQDLHHPARRTPLPATSACRTSSTWHSTTTPPASSATPTPLAIWPASPLAPGRPTPTASPPPLRRPTPRRPLISAPAPDNTADRASTTCSWRAGRRGRDRPRMSCTRGRPTSTTAATCCPPL